MMISQFCYNDTNNCDKYTYLGQGEYFGQGFVCDRQILEMSTVIVSIDDIILGGSM
jgi:hypothetical protein